MKIYLPSDRFKLTHGDLSITVSPLTHAQRIAIASHTEMHEGKAVVTRAGMIETFRQAIKDFSGFIGADDEPLKPEFGEDGLLTLEMAEALSHFMGGTELSVAALMASANHFSQIPEKLTGVEMAVVKKPKAS